MKKKKKKKNKKKKKKKTKNNKKKKTYLSWWVWKIGHTLNQPFHGCASFRAVIPRLISQKNSPSDYWAQHR